MQNDESLTARSMVFQEALTVVSAHPGKQHVHNRFFYRSLKRTMDIALSFFALAVLSVVFLAAAIAIKAESRGPVFFAQMRVGKDGKTFKMYKFRSMCADAEERLKDLKHLNEKDGPVFKITSDPRVTRVGRWIRKLSIDELPQFLNVIRGDMSIVGPRPPLLSEVEQYTPHQLQRLAVKPGLTCYWQISGRSNLSFAEWINLDLKYIRESSISTDIKIMLKTVPVVLLGWGAY